MRTTILAILAMSLSSIPLPHASAQAPQGAQGAEAQPLTDAQKRLVKTVLSKYSEASMSADDARAINEAFRAGGLRAGSGLQEAIAAAGFDPHKISALAPPPGRGGGDASGGPPDRPASGFRGGRSGSAPEPRAAAGVSRDSAPATSRYSVQQAISDRAQQNTIAFDALAFLTGNLGSNTFLPPGKVADFSGFQYMRDIDAGELGHNTSFVPRVANNVLYILNEGQRAKLLALAAEQESMIRAFAYKRFPLIQAFRRLLDADPPTGKTALDRDAVAKYTGELYLLDGEIAYRRAAVTGAIIASLDARQKEYLAKMAFSDSRTWPEKDDQIDKRSLTHDMHVAVMTYASELFSWYAGSIEADTYFCPERHATYFGSFYMKDIPAMGNPDYSISTALTGDSGEAFLAALTVPQRQLITGLVDLQRDPLNRIVEVRRRIATQLRRFQKGETPDKQAVLALARQYGELDGVVSYYYATRFAEVGKSLSSEQKQMLVKLRNLDDFPCTGAYVYSQPIPMPKIESADYLFGKGDPK
jgi:hypothetical protein